jgi:hypothetical protein
MLMAIVIACYINVVLLNDRTNCNSLTPLSNSKTLGNLSQLKVEKQHLFPFDFIGSEQAINYRTAQSNVRFLQRTRLEKKARRTEIIIL